MNPESPKCEKCGYTMVEEFEYRDGPNGITLAIPTGKFSCITCGKKAGESHE